MNVMLEVCPSFQIKPKKKTTKRVTNVATVPQLSPFRYPGGKTWLVPEIRFWLDKLGFRPNIFIEPFAGGGIASLTAIIEDRADKAILCELDHQVAAVWQTILEDADWLIDKILSFDINLNNVRELLSKEFINYKDIAFQALVKNRTQRGGIMAPGASLMNSGENGKGVASRWYPCTIAKRIKRIYEYRERIGFIQGDGMQIIKNYQDDERSVFFIDPPYTASGKSAGKRLYTHNEINHEKLFDLMSKISGKFLMTYDNVPVVLNMATNFGFHYEKVPMKNTHNQEKYELLLTSSPR